VYRNSLVTEYVGGGEVYKWPERTSNQPTAANHPVTTPVSHRRTETIYKPPVRSGRPNSPCPPQDLQDLNPDTCAFPRHCPHYPQEPVYARGNARWERSLCSLPPPLMSITSCRTEHLSASTTLRSACPDPPTRGKQSAPRVEPADSPAVGPMKPTFPSFNKESAVCGYRRAGFFTFYTVVDCHVEKMIFKPAKCRSYGSENRQVVILSGPKKALFP
jgi:hypothetical protein